MPTPGFSRLHVLLLIPSHSVLVIQREQDWIIISQFFLEFAVGVCMVVIVALLLIFRLKEVIECWNIHRRIRFYFVLTIIGILVNLSLGICGTLYVVSTKAE